MATTSGDTWTYACPPFDLEASSDEYGDADKAALCAFQACPGHFYSIEMSACHDSPYAYMDLYSYSETHAYRSGSCTVSMTFMGLEECQLVFVYQYCWGGTCHGQTNIAATPIPPSTVLWDPEAVNTTTGEPLHFSLLGTGVSLSSYQPEAVVTLFRSDMLQRIKDCQYYSYYEGDIYQYLHWAYATDTAIASGAQMNSSLMYSRSPFGGAYKVLLLYYYSYPEVGLGGVYVAGESDELTLGGGSVQIQLESMEHGEVVRGSWSSPHDAAQGDYIALFELNAEGVHAGSVWRWSWGLMGAYAYAGHCNLGAWNGHDSYTHDAVWYMLVPPGSRGGSFNTSAGAGSANRWDRVVYDMT